LSSDADQNVMEVVGIAADARDERVTTPAKPAVYVPIEQAPAMMWPLLQRSLIVALKSSTPNADANALARTFKRVIADFDPSLPVADPHTLTRALESSQATAHATTLLLSALGGIALLLAMVGIYGNLLYGVRGWDPLTLVSATVLLAMVAVTATIVPARRAMRVAPSIALSQR
jgi:putative ABC transport system permease protein